MRLHRLQLGAVGPFASAYDLDLDSAATDGLFLLEGPTGAGKSTVLDAVTFALYGAVAGRSTSKERLHTDFATVLEPFVELEFSVGGIRHRIRRTPTFQRLKRGGSGTTQVQSTVRLWRVEGADDLLLSSRVREADDEVRRLLGGLSAEQFRQVVVLPQGEFATFLRADPDERREVLARLFATDHYQAVEEVLVGLRKDAGARVGTAEALVRDALAALRQASGDGAVDVAELLDATDQDRQAHLDLLEDVLREAADRAEERARGAAAVEAVARADLDDALERLRRHEVRVAAQRAHDALLAQAPVVAAWALRRDAARAAQALAPVLREAVAAATALGELPPVPDGTSPDPEVLRTAAAALSAQADALVATVALEAALAQRLVEITELDAELVALVNERLVLSARVEQAPAGIAGLRAELETARERAADVAPSRLRLAAAQDRLRAWLARPAAQERVTTAADALRVAIDAAQDAREAYQQAVAVRLAGMAAELAAGLEDGLPCAVCGATEHPTPAAPAAVAVDADTLEAREAEAARALRVRDAAAEQLATVTAVHDRLALLGGDVDPTEEIAALADRVAAAEEAARRLAGLEAAVDGAENDVEQDRLRLRQVEPELATAEERARSLAAAHEADAAIVVSARDGHAGVAERRAALLERAGALSAAADAASRRARAQERDVAAAALLAQALDAAGFADLAAARAAALDDPDALAAQVEQHQAAWAVATATLADPAVAGAEQERPDPGAAQARLAEALAAHEVARTEAEAARTRARDVHACRAHLAEAESATAAVRAATRPVVRVADAVTGQGSVNPRRLTLSTYVLRERFDSVVVAASRRLELMSSGRFVLERDESVSGAKKAGLGLTVLDQWTGTRRDTRTLSGGESFYASLALALGLADVVRDEAGGVELETLFIDEGFGMLDADALESVLDVIDALRDGGRVVGIVSHVTELKERIPDRIEVRRLADGSSAVAVHA